MIDLASLVAAIQVKKGNKSARTLAASLGIATSTLCRIINGKAPELATYEAICLWLGVSLDYFRGINAGVDRYPPKQYRRLTIEQMAGELAGAARAVPRGTYVHRESGDYYHVWGYGFGATDGQNLPVEVRYENQEGIPFGREMGEFMTRFERYRSKVTA